MFVLVTSYMYVVAGVSKLPDRDFLDVVFLSFPCILPLLSSAGVEPFPPDFCANRSSAPQLS